MTSHDAERTQSPPAATLRGVITSAGELLHGESGMRGQVVGYGVASLLEGVCFALLLPVLRAAFDQDPGDAVGWIVVLAVVATGHGVALWITENRAYRVGISSLMGGAMREIGNHAARLPLGWFTQDNRTQLTQLVSTSSVQLSITPGLIVNRVVTLIVTPLSVVVVVVFVDWRLATAMTVLALPGLFAFRAVQRVSRQEFESRATAANELTGRIVEFAQAQQVLRSAGLIGGEWRRLDTALAEDYDAVVHQLDMTDKPMRRYMAIVEIGFAAVVALGVLFVVDGSIGTPELMLILILAVRFVEPLSVLAGFGEGIALAHVALARIRDFLSTEPLPEPPVPSSPADDQLRLAKVEFGYDETSVIHGVDLIAPPGATTALVGPSGSGKTTLIRLMARAWDVDGGTVSLGGEDVRDVGTEGVLARMGVVFQHVYLFGGTILENVRFGRPDATRDEIDTAARAARLDEVIERLPDGWDTMVGEGGTRLSGGERQRVSIARALLKNAPIVLLDEVSAALDTINEAAVMDGIAELCRDRTVVIIAHRLSTLAQADIIVVLDAGRIVEQGPSEHLLASKGRYADLHQRVIESAGWKIVDEHSE